MELDVTPEPEPDEREAIAAALVEREELPESAWWRAGLPGADEEP